MDFSKPTFILGDENGVPGIFRLSTTRIANPDRMLEGIAHDMPIKTLSAFFVSEDNGANILPVNIYAKRTHLNFWMPIHKIPLRTYYRIADLEGSKVFQPMFSSGGTHVEQNFTWYVPDGIFVYLCARTVQCPWRVEKIYLVAKISEATGYWKLPLPNQYDDGRLCLGQQIDRIKCNYLSKLAQEVYDLFCKSTWNADQLPDLDLTHELISFNPDGTQLPLVGYDFSQACERKSSPTIEECLS